MKIVYELIVEYDEKEYSSTWILERIAYALSKAGIEFILTQEGDEIDLKEIKDNANNS